MKRIGIPRALLYYQYYPMWKTFFEELGAEVVVSPPTTQAILSGGAARVIADTCLPVKAYIGHVISLAEKCDWIFIPAVRSVGNNVYNCSKFLGLPDMTRAVVPEAPPILEIDIDTNRGKNRLYQAIYKLGRHFTRNPLQLRHASLAAWRAYLDYKELMTNSRLTRPEAMGGISGETPAKYSPGSGSPASTRATIALIGHPYLLYDEHINHRLIRRLEQADVRVLTPEILSDGQLGTAVTRLTGQTYWTYEEEIVGAGGHYLQSEADGVIGLMAFGCGPDSLIIDTVRREANRLNDTAFMSLTLEEHTADAGIITRLEAFLEMIYRKKRKQAEKCA
ncbi:MAG: acyl-CoA dehydratase activase-related protein [Dehalococcoidales bacterium]|nr:acyl-CoA dehydratase activase-related protein [Dehalococcoidales bacterium]